VARVGHDLSAPVVLPGLVTTTLAPPSDQASSSKKPENMQPEISEEPSGKLSQKLPTKGHNKEIVLHKMLKVWKKKKHRAKVMKNRSQRSRR
jgi:hypothetical protein